MIRNKFAHFSTWAKVVEELSKSDSSVTDVETAKAFLSSNTNNPFYYATVFIKETKEIYTHGEWYCSNSGDFIFIPELDASYNYNGIDDAKQNKKHIIGIIDDVFYNNSECYKTSDTSYTIAFYTFKNDGSNSFPINMLSYVVTPTSVSLDRINNLGLTASGSGYGLLSNAGDYKTLKTINGQEIIGSGDITIDGGETLTEADILAMGFTKNAGTITGVSANGTSVATSGVANIPAASTSKYGVTKLSSATNSSSTSLAATASAVKAAYDLAKGKQDKLTSGTNIKTVNGQSLLGSGDIAISGGLSESDIFGDKNRGIIKASAIVDDYGMIYGLPYSSQSINNLVDDKLATESYVDSAVANAGGSSSANVQAVDTGDIIDDVTVDYATKTYVDGLVEDINSVLENINGGTSGGSSSGGGGAYSEVNHGTSDTTFTLTPNVFHIWDDVANLTLTLGSETSGVANEFLFQFTSGSTATTLSLPSDLKWTGELTVEPNMIYQVSILKGLGSVMSWNAVTSIFPANLVVGDNGELGVNVYNYLYSTYGESTVGITEELYCTAWAENIPISSIQYGTYEGETGYWLNKYNLGSNKIVLRSDGIVVRKFPSMEEN